METPVQHPSRETVPASLPAYSIMVPDALRRLGTSVRLERVPQMAAEGRPRESTVLSWAHHLTSGYLGSIRKKMVFI